MTPSTTLSVQHSALLTTEEVASIASAALQTDAPAVIASIPNLSSKSQTTIMGWVGLGNIAAELVAQVVGAIAAAHAAKVAPAA